VRGKDNDSEVPKSYTGLERPADYYDRQPQCKVIVAPFQNDKLARCKNRSDQDCDGMCYPHARMVRQGRKFRVAQPTKAEHLLDRIVGSGTPGQWAELEDAQGGFRIGDRVRTPRGPGNVVDAEGDEVAVKLDGDPGEASFGRAEITNLSRGPGKTGADE
jgi:hypothetical protein